VVLDCNTSLRARPLALSADQLLHSLACPVLTYQLWLTELMKRLGSCQSAPPNSFSLRGAHAKKKNTRALGGTEFPVDPNTEDIMRFFKQSDPVTDSRIFGTVRFGPKRSAEIFCITATSYGWSE